jgi:hypothetical protein
LEEFSLLLVELLVFESVSRTITDDEALLPDCNVIVCGPSVLVAAAALTIRRFFWDTFFCFLLLRHAFAGYFARRIASSIESPGCSIK